MITDYLHSNLLQFKNLSQYKSLFHFSTTISGGVSTGNYTSFNFGRSSGDLPENVEENKQRLVSLLRIKRDNLFIPHQTHSDHICIVDENFLVKSKEEQENLLQNTDAIITNQKGIGIGVTTADCVPVLIYDPVNEVLAAIHAGWRGTVSKIVYKTVLLMTKQFGCKPENLLAGIGPLICPDCFEVGDEVVEAFIKAGFSVGEIGSKNPETGKYHLDLWLANKLLLQQTGIQADHIEISGLCTVTNPDQFFSARRQTIKSGRMLTGGVLIN